MTPFGLNFFFHIVEQVWFLEPVVTPYNDTEVVSLDTNHRPGSEFEIGTTRVMYTAKDQFGRTVSCTFVVEVIKQGMSNIVYWY